MMRVTVFSSKAYDRAFFDAANMSNASNPSDTAYGFELTYLETRLTPATAALAKGADVVCAFVNDVLTEPALQGLAEQGVRLVALRSAGYNNIDLKAAGRLHIAVCRVPAYSPHAVAEHTLALILALNRNIYRAYNRVREGNFALDGLMGFDLYGKTVGVLGTGKIGTIVVHILRGFGCNVLTCDPVPNPECAALGARRVKADELFANADIITLHCPLAADTRHLVDTPAIASMRRGVMLINTSRGALIDTLTVIEGLKSGHIGALGLDVYEEEADLFFEDWSGHVIQDDVFARLLTFPNVLITGHQGFFTREAMWAIAETTLANIAAFGRDGKPSNEVLMLPLKPATVQRLNRQMTGTKA